VLFINRKNKQSKKMKTHQKKKKKKKRKISKIMILIKRLITFLEKENKLQFKRINKNP